MLLITGTGRSGTHFTSELLKKIGYDVPHESIGSDGAASWKHVVSGTFVYIGKNREVHIDSTGFTRILHQVRHPIKVISSMQTFSKSTWTYMANFIELDPGGNPALKAMQAYVYWNRLIEEKAHWRFRIEDLENIFPEFCSHAGIPSCEYPKIPHRARDSRSSRYNALSFNELCKTDSNLASMVEELAVRYGYLDLRTYLPPKLPNKSMLDRWLSR
jgi:hypothetical protein